MAEFNNKKIPLVAVAGPTASGKTSFAIEMARRFGGEIISMDSMQIYKHLNIGTAKADAEEMQGIPHHMLDCVDVATPFSASDYSIEARRIIREIYLRGKLPILCGGTGLYLNSVLYDYNMSDVSFDEELRNELFAYAEQNGNEALHDRLKVLDEVSANEIHPNNVKRVVRAIEICMLSGKPKSQQMDSTTHSVYDSLVFGMEMPRDELYDRINMRVDIMMNKGLEGEIEALLANGILKLCGDASQAAQAIGYKEMLEYKRGETDLSEAVEKIKMNSRRYAKRQLTWFRRIDEIKWLNPTHEDEREEAFKETDIFLKGRFYNEYQGL